MEHISDAVRRTVQSPLIKGRIEETGAFPAAGPSEEFGKEIKDIYTALRRVVIENKLTID